ncbi:hypothetical protein Ancab_000649 [Ancistrocladus abbreviatus]
MLSKKICPNEITYNTLIDGFCEDENLPAAMKVFTDMEMRDLKADVVTYNSLISGLCNDQKIHEALDLRDEMLGCGLQPNIATYSALINGYSEKGMLKEARELSNDAARQGLAPTAWNKEVFKEEKNKIETVKLRVEKIDRKEENGTVNVGEIRDRKEALAGIEEWLNNQAARWR